MDEVQISSGRRPEVGRGRRVYVRVVMAGFPASWWTSF